MQERPQKGDIYYHFKHYTENTNNDPSYMVYRVVGIAANATDNQYNDLVIYEPFEDTSHTRARNVDYYARPVEEFLQEVDKPGYQGPRFARQDMHSNAQDSK